jgi:general secretion pathway protein F
MPAMSTFVYKAVNRQGRPTDGRLEAADSQAASFAIRTMGLIPVSIEEPAPSRDLNLGRLGFSRVGRRDILFFTEELSTLVHAGLPLDRSLSVTAELTSNPALERVIRDVLKQIKGGKSLADALATHPKQFSSLYVNMIRAGEAGGVLDVILARLTEFERSADELRSYLFASLIYPLLLTLVGVGSLGILFYMVIPRFAAIFEDVGAAIPPMTLAMLTFSVAIRSYWWAILIVVTVTVLIARQWMKSTSGSRQWDAMKLKMPLIGPTLIKIEVARFSRTLGTLLNNAVPLIRGVRIVQDIVRNQIVSEAISKIAEGAKRGEGVAQPMRAAGVFPGLAVHLVAVGEETGRLDNMLLQLADVYEKDVKTSVKAITAVFEPAIILVMGILIGTVVLSMLMAIFSINEIAL